MYNVLHVSSSHTTLTEIYESTFPPRGGELSNCGQLGLPTIPGLCNKVFYIVCALVLSNAVCTQG